MKKQFLSTGLIVGAGIFIISCSNSANNTPANGTDTAKVTTDTMNTRPATSMADTGKMSSATASTGKTNDFVNKAAAGGMMEVAMGKLAQENGSSNDVREYGKMLEKDHGLANTRLKDIAAAENISIPTVMTNEQNGHVSHLQGIKGSDFDKAFIPMMVDDHTKDIAEFKKAAAGNEDKKVKDFASATLPILETHLARAKAIKAKMK